MAWLTYTGSDGTLADFPLVEDRVGLGRSTDNGLVLSDPSVSRNHAAILRRDDGFVLVDQNSSLGVVVNGKAVREHTLEDGDKIVLGRQAICFRNPSAIPELTELDPADQPASAVFEWIPDVGKLSGAVRELLEASRELGATLGDPAARVEARLKALEADIGRARHQHEILLTLLRVSRLVHSVSDLEKLLSLVVNLAVKVLAADRGFLIMRDDDDRLSVGASHNMRSEEHTQGTISFGVANQVLQDDKGLLSDDATTDPRFLARRSVLDMGIRSVLCVPLRKREAPPLGVIYLDRLASEIPFATEDLESLQGLANVAAVAVENARLRHEGARRIRAEEDLRQARELESLKADFLSMVSHDLRTPLTSIKSWAEILQDDWERISDEERNRYLSIVNGECDRLTRLINDLLDMQKMESGHMEIDARAVRPGEMLRQAADACAASARAREVDLSITVEPKLPKVLADPARIAQVLSNLLGNALKFTPRGGSIGLHAASASQEAPSGVSGQTVTIDLNAAQATSFVRFSVADTGDGIPPEMLDTIFEKFRQVDEAQPGRPKGSGLGLSICRQIVEKHGGRMGLESQVGRGSTFSFLLPVSRQELDTIP